MYELSKTQFVHEIIHKMVKNLKVKKSRWSEDVFFDATNEEGRVSKDQEYLKQILCSDSPLMIGRLGAIELVAFLNYLQINDRLPANEQFNLLNYYCDNVLPNWWSVGSQRSMCNNAGFFPANSYNLNKWAELMDNDIKCVDILLRWLKNENLILPLNENMNFLAYRNVEYPFKFKNPYVECFEGKRILVVSPFSKTIESQFTKMELIWGGYIKMCPRYELQTLQSYNILGGHICDQNDVTNWFEALNKMKDSISNKEFDIALIGCGAYAFHLAAHVKRMGKKAITTCGSTQLLFGIYGNRWEKFLIDNKFLNQYWTRPFDEKPEGYEKVENAAYW